MGTEESKKRQSGVELDSGTIRDTFYKASII